MHRRQLESSGAGSAAIGVHNVSRLFVLAAQDRIEELGETAGECATQLAERRGFKYAVTFNSRAMLLVGRAEYEEARGLLLQARPLHDERSEEHTSELRSLMRISYAVFCLQKQNSKC